MTIRRRRTLVGGLCALALLTAGSVPPGLASASTHLNGPGRTRRRNAGKPTVGVMLVDSRAVVRAGLCAVIEPQPDLVVVAEAATVHDAGGVDVTPDVIVTRGARGEGAISGLRELFRQSPILVLTPTGDLAGIQSAFSAGAHGYLPETGSTDDVLTGIRAVAGGDTYLHPSLGVDLARVHRRRDAIPALTPLEAQVLRLLALGHTNAEVARLCNISLRSAEFHRAHIQRKAGCRTRAQLVEYARKTALI